MSHLTSGRQQRGNDAAGVLRRSAAAAAEAWDRCIDVNFKGVLHGITAVHDQMTAQGRGHIVNITSIYGNAPVAGAAVYGATKAAVNVLSESLRVGRRRDGSRSR